MKASLYLCTALASMAAAIPVIEDRDDGLRIEPEVEGDRVSSWDACAPYFESWIDNVGFNLGPSCQELGCLGDCGISLCNDEDYTIRVAGPEVAASAQGIKDKCVAEDGTVKGQGFSDPAKGKDWNLIIKHSTCETQHGLPEE